MCIKGAAVYGKETSHGSGYGWTFLVVAKTREEATQAVTDLMVRSGLGQNIWDQNEYDFVLADPDQYNPGEGWKIEKEVPAERLG